MTTIPDGAVWSATRGEGLVYFFNEAREELGYHIEDIPGRLFRDYDKPRKWDESFLNQMKWTKIN